MTADSRAGCAEVCCNQPLHSVMMMWREVTPAEVRRTVLAAAAVKSCSLDPILTYLLCDCIHALLLCSMTIVNISLHEACRPMPEYQTNSFSQRTDVITQQKTAMLNLLTQMFFLQTIIREWRYWRRCTWVQNLTWLSMMTFYYIGWLATVISDRQICTVIVFLDVMLAMIGILWAFM